MIDMNYEVGRARIYFMNEARRRGLPATSRLFVILDHGGGWRFVVTTYDQINWHIGPGERKIMVPRVRISEPVDWNDIPRTIRLAERWATKWMVRHGYNAIPDPRMEVLE